MLSKAKGFTLIEMMMVIGIITVLTAIGIPAYERYVTSAKTAEARTGLSNLYFTERMYMGNWFTYFADFRNLGYVPEGDLNYNLGFSAAGRANAANYTGIAPNVPAGGAAVLFNTLLYCANPPVPAAPTCNSVAGNPGVIPAGNVTGIAGANPNFTAYAIGNIDGDATFDQWRMNDQKTLTHVVDDVNN
jgi:prepilin-type N-terminal cleavage/methylation domain-containing protein